MPEGQSSTKPLLSKYALCQEFYPAEAHKGERCTCFDQKPSEPVTIKKHNYSTAHTQILKRLTAKAAAPASTLRDLVHHTGGDTCSACTRCRLVCMQHAACDGRLGSVKACVCHVRAASLCHVHGVVLCA